LAFKNSTSVFVTTKKEATMSDSFIQRLLHPQKLKNIIDLEDGREYLFTYFPPVTAPYRRQAIIRVSPADMAKWKASGTVNTWTNTLIIAMTATSFGLLYASRHKMITGDRWWYISPFYFVLIALTLYRMWMHDRRMTPARKLLLAKYSSADLTQVHTIEDILGAPWNPKTKESAKFALLEVGKTV
jgi:hypothetical protein